MASINNSQSSRYEETIGVLNILQTNQSTLKSGDQRGKSLYFVTRYLSHLNVQLDQINALNVIHVAGTKGKGSTCALTESILRQYGYKTGFYSSPHLVEVRERIRINGELLSKEKFIDYFWQCYNEICKAVQKSTDEDPLPMPFYFSFLTTMMFYVFVHEKVDVAVVEVGIGGEFDCTNIITAPVVCGITSLGLDHVTILGNSIEQIAWQKAGIFKNGVPAITAPQPQEAMRVLYERAQEKCCSLTIAPPLNSYQNYPFHVSLAGNVQEINASVAIQLVCHWLKARRGRNFENILQQPLDHEMLEGLAKCRWSGRNEIIKTDIATYYLDGAHTVESIEQCHDWFVQSLSKQEIPSQRILLFYCSYDRQPEVLLQPLMKYKFDSVVFCSPITSLENTNQNSQKDARFANDQWRATTNTSIEFERLASHANAYENLWSSCEHKQTKMPSIYCFATVEQALSWIRDIKSSKPSILVTGSLYLVGAVLKLLIKND